MGVNLGAGQLGFEPTLPANKSKVNLIIPPA